MKRKVPKIAKGDRRDLPVGNLLLDPENPRLAAESSEDLSQDSIVEILWREMAVDEVALSIANNGFYSTEPLLAIQSEGKKRKFVVVEGNRRLAAVRLLRDENLRRRVKANEMLPSLSKAELTRLGTDVLPVMVFETREELWAHLGFRHVNGTKEWDAFAKAQFVAHVHQEYGVPVDEIADRIGDRNSTVSRFYRGYLVLQQAEAQTKFNRTDLWSNRFYFSHLYTAVDQPEFKRFLGLKERWKLVKNPVPKSRIKNLEELVTWIYGRKSEKVEPIVRTQAPDLSNLRMVIGQRYSLSLLRQGYSLEACLEATRDDSERFEEAIVRAKESLQKAKGMVSTGYRGEKPLLATVEAIVTTATTILQEMRSTSLGSRGRRKD